MDPMDHDAPAIKSGESPVEAENLTQEEINERLRRKRKSRGQKACYPCRQRKVGCNYAKPCQKCVDRDHPELCLYEPISKRPNISQLQSSSSTAVKVASGPPKLTSSTTEDLSVSERLATIEQSLQELRQEFAKFANNYVVPRPSRFRRSSQERLAPDSDSEELDEDELGLHTSNAMTGETVHLGGNSVPAMVVALGGSQQEDAIEGLLGKSILPIFGLDNESATYPFVDLWGLPHGSYARLEGLCKLLPSDDDCLQYFKSYRDTAHIIFPAVVDISQFENDLTRFLIRRASSTSKPQPGSVTIQDVYGKTLHWVGLLFAILSSGYQCSSVSRKQRQLTCQVYVCCAYECLRIVNYLSNATLLDIQSMLILGNVVSNNMNAGVAWCFLGLTIRLGQSLGLHQKSSKSSEVEGVLREELWWRIVWQDSLLSITYDRASSTPTISHHKSLKDLATPRLSYIECMKILCTIGLEIVRERTHHSDFKSELARIQSHRDELDRMMERAVHHLRDATASRSVRDQLEHWNLYMHRSYILSELYRATMRRKGMPTDLQTLRTTCLDHLADTVDAFLGLQSITRFATQSWAAIHRGLSSALLLGILKQPRYNQRVHLLLDKLISVMTSVNSSDDPTEVSAPITRAIEALSRLNSISKAEPDTRVLSRSVSTATWEPTITVESMIYTEKQVEELDRSRSSESSPYEVMEKILWSPR